MTKGRPQRGYLRSDPRSMRFPQLCRKASRDLFGESWEPLLRCHIQWRCTCTAIVAATGRFNMVFVRFAGALAAALLLASGIASAQSPKITDPQIAHIAYTAGQLDIAAAQLALQKSKSKDVVAFATDMERDHKAVNEQALALVKKLNVTPEDNDTSKALTKQAADKRAELAKLSGTAFDKAYIDNEVAYHKTVNGALQNTLIPSATNPELKDLLTTGLKIFQGHEQHAEHVAAEFK
jgi:putative membrane protein